MVYGRITDGMAVALGEDMENRQNRTKIEIVGHGLFVARTEDVASYLTTHTKRQMVKDIADLWPELIRDKSWTRADLRTMPAYVLAVILNQI
jgi:hypothetical protein